MTAWNAELYLRFERERTQPAIDLAQRIPLAQAASVLDVGCGPGNSTAVLARRFPGAAVLGIDNAPDMLARARQTYPDLSFALRDATTQLSWLPADYDIVFSNACLQWIPDHPALLPALLAHLRPGGVLAVQVPLIEEEPIHRILLDVSERPRWHARCARKRAFFTLSPGAYYDLLSATSSAVDMWQTDYLHVMPAHAAIVDWYRGTGMRPYMEALNEAERAAFEADILAEVTRAYPIQRDGAILFRFPRLFFVAVA